MKNKYLAYIALLAGWLIFCYWLYAKEIYPRFHPPQGTPWPVYDDELKLPVAYSWGSDIPIAGEGFSDWIRSLQTADSTQNIIVFKSYFFRDEAESINAGRMLGKSRVDRIIYFAGIDRKKILTEISPGEVSFDAHSQPFEAVKAEIFKKDEVLSTHLDTLEICFPLKDSILLPAHLWSQIEHWIEGNDDKKDDNIQLVGTADGSGISEATDIAWERAYLLRQRLLKKGWAEENIIITTGQRSHENAIRNRCVIIFFE